MLEEEVRRRGLEENLLNHKRLEQIVGSLSFSNVPDLMVAIANKQVSLQAVIERLTKHKISAPIDNEDLLKLFNRSEHKPPAASMCRESIR